MLTTTRRIAKIVTVTVITVLFLAFAVDNRQFVNISLFPLTYSVSMPEFLLAMLCFALGVVVGGISIGIKLSKAKRLARAEHRRLMALEHEVEAMRAQPGNLPAAVKS